MLLSFQVKNSRSILDVTVPMMYAEKKAPNGYNQMELLPFLQENKIRTVPCMAIYGANASGKSNIVKAFLSFVGIIKVKYQVATYAPNKLHPENDTITYILEFLTDGNKFRYTLETNAHEILTEELTQNSERIFSINNRDTDFKELSTEVYSSPKLATIFSVECLDQKGLFLTPFITVVGKNYAGLHTSMTTVFSYIINNLEVYSSNDFPFTLGLNKLTQTYGDKESQKAFDDIVTILRKLDIDITRMEYKQDVITEALRTRQIPGRNYELQLSNNKFTATEINSYHKDILGNEVQFNFNEESLGTQRIASLLGVVLSKLRKGGILVMDELGNSLHPLLFSEIVRMFKDKRYNTSNAQLIFTTHNTDIMEQDMMRVSEIGIVNRTLKKGTTFKRVSDFEGIRNVTNFRKQYLDGNFSGIPFPYI